ncbi:hypothetical protein HRTV-2_gp51 [Halorubrum virus HRTV-2]|nr:hypothetical protein HRTV-2_gp51 [Halorubrum virus HRTV-2]
MREPLVMHSEDLDHIEEMVEALSEGYHINAPTTDETRDYYSELLDRLQEARP